MPQLISKYRIFVASPSDLSDEREAINDVISELNLTYGNPNNLTLELLKWETNSAPGISEQGVQSIINSDIPEYDLFIGLLWMKFGTATEQYGSGTEEEFSIAHDKFKNDKNVQILIYFKNSPPPSLDEINTEQLAKVREFRSGIGEKGVLYWEFNFKEELERFLRIHIRARIENLRNSITAEKELYIKKNIEKIEIIADDDDELGILDYQELIEESFTISSHSLSIISDATSLVGREMTKKSAEISRLVNQNRNQPISVKAQRSILERTAIVMNDFASRIDPEIPIYISHFEKGIDAFEKLANIYKSDFDNKKDELLEAKESLDGLLYQIQGTLVNMTEFLETLESWPRMSKELNSARKNVTSKLRDFLNRIEVSYSIAREVHKNM